MNKGCVHLYTGDGKGKTTAAVGLAVRFAGSGGRVLFVQFLKSRPTGEIEPLKKLGVDVIRSGRITKFTYEMDEKEKSECRKECENCFMLAEQKQSSCGLVVFDEVLDAVETGMLSEQRLLDYLAQRPVQQEVVLTGRTAGKRLIALADYHSEVMLKKHPYYSGQTARQGIEY